MKNFLLLALMSLVATSAQARSKLPFNNAESIFQQLEQRFAAASVPSPEISGWFSGRCYSPEYPSEPVGGFLSAVTVAEKGPDNGPLFPPANSEVFKLTILTNGDAAYYDNMSDFARKDTQEMISLYTPYVSPVAIIQNAWQSDVPTSGEKWRVRQDGDYLFSQSIATRDFGSHYTGDSYYNCYFFKNVDIRKK